MCVCLLLVHTAIVEPIWLKLGLEIDYILDWRMGYFYPRKIHGTYGISKKPGIYESGAASIRYCIK